MLRRNRHEACRRLSSRKRLQKQLVRSKFIKKNICRICKKHQTLGLCMGRHKQNVHNQSVKTSKCITCGKQFIAKRCVPGPRKGATYQTPTPKVVKSINCLACRKKRLAKEKIIMKRKIMKLVQKTEILLRKCASAASTEMMVDFLNTVQVRLGVLRQNLNVLNAVNAL